MLNAPTALALTAAPLKDALHEYGVDFTVLAQQAGIDPNLLTRPNARYPTARIVRLWELAAERSGDPLFGFRVGSLARPGMFHALGLGIVSSPTLLSALQRIERYGSIVSTNGRFVVVTGNDTIRLETRPSDRTILPTTHCVDAMVVAVCRVLEQCAGPAAIPAKVVFMRERTGPTEAYRAVLKCPVEFDGRHIAIAFDAAMAATPVSGGNPELASEADRLAERYLEYLTPDSTAARVRRLLIEALPSGGIDQGRIARSLNQSASTLQRRLRREGLTYQELLDRTRHEMALDYLRQGRHSLADIAFMLGFADQANFTRAFRRWTGRTPGAFLD